MDNNQSNTFVDSAGREWSINVSAGTCRKIQQKTSVNLLNPDQDIEAIFKLASSPHLLIDVLWIACQGQHDGVDENQFCDVLGGNELSQAIGILKGKIVSWCEQLSPNSGIALRLEKASKFETAKRERLVQLLDSPEIDKIAKEHLDNAYRQGVDALQDLLGT